MGDDSLILREDGYIRMNFPVSSLTYHSNLNIILVKTDVGGVHVLDVNSGVILESSCLSADEGGALGIEYAPGADRVFVWDSSGVGARSDYNGVLLLHTALQRPLRSSQPEKVIRIELVLSEAVLLYQCLQSLGAHVIEGLSDFINELKHSIDREPVRKGVKAQKWSTVTICLPQSTLRMVTIGVVQELKGQNRRIPALSIASAVGQRANDLVPCTKNDELRALMYSEAERKETFKRWPHMDYKWALPARMAQAGFYHQPTPCGDDRAMCFTCTVCLVCWEKSDEPWVEHERHSPSCPFVRGEYTHNVPMSVTNATACATPSPNVCVVSKGNTGDLIATGTIEGKVNIWKFDCGLKLVKYIHLTPYDSIFSGILSTDYNKVWSASLEKDSSTYALELCSMAFVGMTSQQDPFPQAQTTEPSEKETNSSKTKPSLICAVIITRTCTPSDQSITEDSTNKALFDSGNKSNETIQEMNDQNDAKNNLPPSNRMLFLLTYDIHSSSAGSITTVVHTSNSSGNSKPGGSKKLCTVSRTDDANIYDDIYFQYSDEDTELQQCTKTIINEMSNVINLNASSSKEDSKIWEPKKIILAKHLKILPPPPPTALLPELPETGHASMYDVLGKISGLKSWKSTHFETIGTKVTDQTDAALEHADPITHYFNMNGPLEISDLKWYESGEGTDKVKVATFVGGKVGIHSAVSNSNNDGFDSDPPQEDVVLQGVAIQCLSLPTKLNLNDKSRVTYLYPTEDKEHLLVIVSNVNPERLRIEEDLDLDEDVRMDVDETDHHMYMDRSDERAYFLLYKLNNKTSIFTLEDNPISIVEVSFNESPVDLCLLPPDKQDRYSFASVGIDGTLRLYSLPDFKLISEKRFPKEQFISVVYCASVERLSVATKRGMIYFYALNNGEKDSSGDIDDDEFANIDFGMLQRAPKDEVCGPTPAATPPVIIANKGELDMSDLEDLMTLAGSYGTNTTVPYSAVVPGFWCELSPAQRSRSDHQNNRTWRLQNTSSTWDEHVLELTLPYSASLAHIEFGFTLHTACTTNLPVIHVTLLKQNLHGIGYKKDVIFGFDFPKSIPLIENDTTNLENPVNSEEYLQAHNAEILAGPLLLSSGLDLTQQAGTLILTSPRLYRARGRTFLIHIKTLFDPAKDMNKGSIKTGESNSKKSGFIGCDWLHQISLTVRSCPFTDLPVERQQRIAMLESNSFLNTLCEIAVSKSDTEKRALTLDLIIWVISIRLQRLRLGKDKGKDKDVLNPVEVQQLECIKTIEKHTDALIKKCILCANRSIAKKCVKIFLITSEGVRQLPKPWKSTFETTLTNSIASCIPYLGACSSPGAMRWLVGVAQQCTQRSAAPDLVASCAALLERCARALASRADVYHQLLRARFGLYGLPLERSIFASEVPELGKGTSTPVTYASVLAGDASGSHAAHGAIKNDQHLRELLQLPPQDQKPTQSTKELWPQNNGIGVFGAGLSEAMPLHVTCHIASDGTKLESNGAKHHPAVINTLPGDPNQLWTAMKEGQMKQNSQDPDSLEDVESTLMDCDPQEKVDFTEEKLFKDQEQCNIPWAALVTRPPQHTLVVERMHSGARRYIVLDCGHMVRLTDVIIPSCSDLVTLGIDIWTLGEETDSVKLAFATDIASKHLVLTDIQPAPLCRFIKITTIGRYGMSAMKCKIPLGWFYGELAEIANVQASLNALNALHEDLTCKFRLATGKLMDLLNPYLELYNGNAAHMMAYLNLANDMDPTVVNAYQECIDLQQQLHTCNNIMRKLQNGDTRNEQILDMIEKGKVTSESLLERASTDKLRVLSENLVQVMLYFMFQISDLQYRSVRLEWCRSVSPLVHEWGGVGAAALATLVTRACAEQPWWGAHLADTLTDAFAHHDRPPIPLDRCLVLVMYMCRKSLYSGPPEGGAAQALAERALSLLRPHSPLSPHTTHPAHPALTAAVLTVLAAVLDAVAGANNNSQSRWEWVSGSRAGGNGPASGAEGSSVSAARGPECKLHRRKVHKKLLHQMQELEAARRGIQLAIEDQRGRFGMKARMAMVGKRGKSEGAGGESSEGGGETGGARGPRPVSAPLASALAQALVAHILAMDTNTAGDTLLLCAKVVGRLCALAGGASLLEPASVLGLARLAVSLPPWPRHALTTLLQDLVENEGKQNNSSNSDDWGSSTSGASSSRVIRVTQDDTYAFGKTSRKVKGVTVADMLADSFHMMKNTNFSKPKVICFEPILSNSTINTIKVQFKNDMDYHLSQVIESDDSDTEDKLEQFFLDNLKKESKSKPTVDNSVSNISSCVDARLESGAAGGEAAARRVLVAGSAAVCAAIRAPLPRLAPPALSPPASGPANTSPPLPTRSHPPLAHTLYDVFRHLALEFRNQMDCSFMENVVSLWLTLNGSSWSNASPWTTGTLCVPSDTPSIRLASDTVNALLYSLCQLESVTLRCWVLSMQALAWIANLPLQTEGSPQTMSRIILDNEYFVPAIVKFINMNVSIDGSIYSSEPYLGGSVIGGGAGASSALHAVLSRVVCGRGAAGAACALRCVCAAWCEHAQAHTYAAYDLHAVLLRLAAPLLPALSLNARNAPLAVSLFDTISQLSWSWVRESGSRACEAGSTGPTGTGSGGGSGGGVETGRVPGMLADVLAGGGATRRALLRHAVLGQLLHYCRALLAVPLQHAQAGSSGSGSGGEQSQTDESKATQQQHDTTNVEDERKQQAARTPCLADTVLQNPIIMLRFYRTLSMCDGLNTLLLNSGMNSETSLEHASLKEELFWLVSHMANVASNPALMVPSLMEFLRKDEIINLSQAMQQLIVRVLDKPEALAAYVDAGGLELAVEKLVACHQAGPSNSQGLVSSLMNHLKLPLQIINLSTSSSSSNKKYQIPIIETSNGLLNIAPLCTVSCGSPMAQAADVLLGGGASGSGSGGGAVGTCAARRVRASAWSYHFSADDASLALTLTLPHAAQLHEIHLQPHLTNLATCPGAVAIEAGCGGTVAPLGPPQNTSGMTSIRLVVSRPVVCTTVLIRLYKPRDSSNMGLLQLRVLVAPAFNNQLSANGYTNKWSCVVSACTRSRLEHGRWRAVCGPGAVAALCGALVCGGGAGAHAHRALLAAARSHPAAAPTVLTHLLQMDGHAHAHAFQWWNGSRSRGSVEAVCEAVRQVCRQCAPSALPAYLQWLSTAAHRTPPAALTHTLAAVLWSLKEEQILDGIEELITDDLFELIYRWVTDVPETSLLKKSLDAIICSMCFIRPELFRMLLERMNIPMDQDESMEGITDDSKVHSSPYVSGSGRTDAGGGEGGSRCDSEVAWRLRGWQLRTVAAAAHSPHATRALLCSRLPNAVVNAIAEFSEAKLQLIKAQLGSQEDVQMTDYEEEADNQKTNEVSSMNMSSVCQLVEWARLLCSSRRLQDWLGSVGSAFWRPLLMLLCYPRHPESTWQEGAAYAQLEENTIRLFAELTVCHATNQKLFAATLHNILESLHCTGPAGLSGFTRALVLRLLLSSERAWVGVRWAGAGGAAPPHAAAPPHPAAHCHALLSLPLHTTLRTLLLDHRPPMPLIDESSKACVNNTSGSGSCPVVRSASDTAILTVTEAWELLAAASASKDKRVKDVKNISLKQQNNKKRQFKNGNESSVMLHVTDELIETTIRVQVPGLEGFIPASTTLAQLVAAAPHERGPHLTLTLHLNASGGPTWEGGVTGNSAETGNSIENNGYGSVLREFGACGGLALVAARLPRPHPLPVPHPQHNSPHQDLDWVKLDDPYEEALEMGLGSAMVGISEGGSSGGGGGATCGGVPAHALAALGLLLKLPGYAAALLDEGARAVHLLRLLLGVTHDENGRSIVVSGGGGGSGGGEWSLGTLPFLVMSRLLERAALGTPPARELRRALLRLGAVRLVLACLSVFTHHRPASNDNSQASNGSSTGRCEEKSQLYWAKGTGFGTGSTQQSWNVEQALVRQRTEEEHVTVLLQVLASFMNPGEKWPPEEGSMEEQTLEHVETDTDTNVEVEDERGSQIEVNDLPVEFIDLVVGSSLVPAISSYLRNDSVLDMSRHIPLYVCVLKCARALSAVQSACVARVAAGAGSSAQARAARLSAALRPLPPLLAQMSRTTNSYATKLRMSKKNLFGKMTYSQRFSTSSNSELSEEDEGLASLIADIQATSALLCRSEGGEESGGAAPSALSGVTRESRYIELMRTMQFETFEMMAECPESGFRFTVPYHFEGTVRAAGERSHPARMKRLAQEAATLATSLPLSYSSSVFVRTDTDRLDVMKVLITGPSDTPYANGCFVLDVYFPAEYPATPMLINLETTGRHSVRFNPNLYNDGKVCLSVLNTWHGRPEEKWNAHTSSFLQVLVSIQSLILVPEPYFNEPGYERSRGTRAGSAASLEYNSNIYQACVRWAMLDHLRNPSPCFKEVIQTHFWMKRNEIMQTVSNWISELEGQSGDERTQRAIHLNLMALKRHYVKLQEELAKLPTPPGLEDMDEPFQLPATVPSSAPAAATTPTPASPTATTTYSLQAVDDIDQHIQQIVSQVLD